MCLRTRPPKKATPSRSQLQRLLRGHRARTPWPSLMPHEAVKAPAEYEQRGLACPMAIGTGSCATADNQCLLAVGEHVNTGNEEMTQRQYSPLRKSSPPNVRSTYSFNLICSARRPTVPEVVGTRGAALSGPKACRCTPGTTHHTDHDAKHYGPGDHEGNTAHKAPRPAKPAVHATAGQRRARKIHDPSSRSHRKCVPYMYPLSSQQAPNAEITRDVISQKIRIFTHS